MSIIDRDGLFGGDRLRRCSNMAQLHFPRLFLASDGFGRLEINYARIIGMAYPTFNPVPSETEIQSWIQEYMRNFLLFLYEWDGRIWGQWDTNTKFLPRFKTSADRRSPQPPDPAFTDWKRKYRAETKALPECFGRIPKALPSGVGGGIGVGEGKSVSSTLEEPPLTFNKRLDDWAERLYSRHPKKRDKGLVEKALFSVLEKAADRDALMAEIDRKHALWCKTPEWNEKNGAFAPVLAQWIVDHGWTRAPDGAELPPPRVSVEEEPSGPPVPPLPFVFKRKG